MKAQMMYGPKDGVELEVDDGTYEVYFPVPDNGPFVVYEEDEPMPPPVFKKMVYRFLTVVRGTAFYDYAGKR